MPRLIVLVLAAAALLGCGGDSLAEQANAICARYAADAEALGEPSADELDEYFVDAADLARRQQDELEALEPEGDYPAFLAATERTTALLEDIVAAADDRARANDLIAELEPLSDEVDAAARAIGAADCGN